MKNMTNGKFRKSVGLGLLGLAVLASGQTAFAAGAATNAPLLAAENADNNSYGQKLFSVSVSVSQGAGTVAYTPVIEDLEHRGPESFAVHNNGDVYLLDTIDSQVEIYSASGKAKETVQLPSDREFFDIELAANETFFALNDLGEVLEYRKGQLVATHVVPVEEGALNVIGLFQGAKNNSVVVRYLDGSEIDVTAKQKGMGHGGYAGKREGNAIKLSGKQNITVDYAYEPAGTQALTELNGEQLVLENEAIIGSGVYVETRVGKYKNGKRVGTALALPTNDYAAKVPGQYVYAASNGKVYQMVLKDGSVDIVELNMTANKRTNLTAAKVQQMNQSAAVVSAASDDMVTIQGVNAYGRTTAYDRAIGITGYSWTFNSANRTPSTSTTTSPDFLASAATGSTHLGIPYCWGGFDSLDTSSVKTSWSNYANGLSKGKYAGNVHTSGHNYISSTVGLDCSGFISAIYGFSYKFSTGMLQSDPATPFKTTSYSLLQPGDIANDAGNHTWMYVSKKTDSAGNHIGYFTREATVSGTGDKAKYYSRTLTEAQGYVPMTLK